MHVEYSAHPERRDDGVMTGVLGAFRDVTVEREQQVALAEERQRLLVDIRKRQEVEGQLRQAKDEFLATLAHELRNPLAPLRNIVEILRLEPLSDTARQATGVMDRQIAQLVRLIDDLMDVSRITRGHLTLQRQPSDLRTIIESAIETAQPQQAYLLDVDATRISQNLPEPADQRREVHAGRRPHLAHRHTARRSGEHPRRS